MLQYAVVVPTLLLFNLALLGFLVLSPALQFYCTGALHPRDWISEYLAVIWSL